MTPTEQKEHSEDFANTVDYHQKVIAVKANRRREANDRFQDAAKVAADNGFENVVKALQRIVKRHGKPLT